jgi:hypothetical protein
MIEVEDALGQRFQHLPGHFRVRAVSGFAA